MRFVELDQQIEQRAGLRARRGLLAAWRGLLSPARTRHARRSARSRDSRWCSPSAAAWSPRRRPTRCCCATTTTIWLKAEADDYWTRVIRQGDRRPMDQHPQAREALRQLVAAARAALRPRATSTVDTPALCRSRTGRRPGRTRRSQIAIGVRRHFPAGELDFDGINSLCGSIRHSSRPKERRTCVSTFSDIRGRAAVRSPASLLLRLSARRRSRARAGPAADRAAAPGAPMHQRADHPALRGFRWREIGPTGQGGRIDDLAVDEKNPSTFLRRLRGERPVADDEQRHDLRRRSSTTYGAARSATSRSRRPNPNILYVGTGEAEQPPVSSFGNGMFKTTNASRQAATSSSSTSACATRSRIARVIVHPKDPNIVWVAAVGHLFGPNPERGVFMTTDGGKTWTKTLYVNREHRRHRARDRSDATRTTCGRRRTSGGARRGASSAAARAAAFTRATDGGKTWTQGHAATACRAARWAASALDICEIAAERDLRADRSGARQGNRRRSRSAAAGGSRPGRRAAPAGGAARRRWRRWWRRAAAAVAAAARRIRSRNGIWRSADKGKTWKFLSQPEPAADVLQPDPRRSEQPEHRSTSAA